MASDSSNDLERLRAGPAATGRVLVRAGCLVDATGVDASPGVLLLEDGRILAAGDPASIGAVGDAVVLDHERDAVIPALVNAHAHLDLSHVPPIDGGGDFTRWIGAIRAARHPDEASIAASVRRGIELSIAGGTAAIGDIAGAGSPVPTEQLRGSPLMGVSYREFFGVGGRQPAAAEAMAAAVLADARERLARDAGEAVHRVRLGISPHAPYSCGPAVYAAAAAAAAAGVPVATHLAETLEERRFVREGGGRFEAFLREIGAWDDAVVAGPDAMAATGREVVDLVLESLARGGLATAPVLAAHGNYLDPAEDRRLAEAGVGIVYCPRASAWFGHPHEGREPHPWRRLAAAGVRVCLGTDGLPCLDTPDRIGVLDEMRLLVRRDGAAAREVLAMGTVHGAEALGLDAAWFTFAAGPVAGVLAIGGGAGGGPVGDRLEAAVRHDAPPRWILGPVWPGRGG